MRRGALLTAAVVVLAGVSAAVVGLARPHHSATGHTAPTKLGTTVAIADRQEVGAVTGQLLDGGSYELSRDAGHVVVLNFFASWCPPCQIETPQFDTIYRERKDAGVRFVGLDVKDRKDNIISWLAAKKITYPVVFDAPAKTAIELGDVPVTGLPDTVVIDKHGRVAALYIGPLTPADLNPVLDQLQAEA